MKISIIGGGGLVGSSTAFALQCGGVGSSLCLIDANAELAQGRRDPEDLLVGAAVGRDDLDDLGLTPGQRAGLVERQDAEPAESHLYDASYSHLFRKAKGE